MSKIINYDGEDFDNEIILQTGLTLVDFYAIWCGPCQMLLPVIDEIATEAEGFKVGKINVDEQPELASQFKVRTIPTLMVFKNGEVVNKSIGVIPKDEILKLVQG